MDQFQSRNGASDAFGAIGGDSRWMSILRRNFPSESVGTSPIDPSARFFEHEESLRVARNAECEFFKKRGSHRQFACCKLHCIAV